MMKVGDTVEADGTKFRVLVAPAFKVHRDAAYWTMRAVITEGEWKGEEGWLTADSKEGPWNPAGVGFI
jgi:hypothetical protein